MKNLSKIKKALFGTIIFFAVSHLIILGAKSLLELNLYYLNIFKILGTERYLPGFLSKTPEGNFFSLVLVATVFVLIYFFGSKKS